MHKIPTKTPLIAIDSTNIRRVACDWRSALQAVRALAEQQPGAPTIALLDGATRMIEQAEGKPMTLADAVADALLSGEAAEKADAAEKLRRWELATKFHRSDVVEMGADDRDFVQKNLAAIFRPAVYGPAYDALNGVTR